MWLLTFLACFVIGYVVGVTVMALPVLVVYGLPLAFAVAVTFAVWGVTRDWRERLAWRRSDKAASRRALANW